MVADVGLMLRYEMGLFDPEASEGSNYRVPDLMVFAPDRMGDRGVEGAAAVTVKLRSPGDETLDKLGFHERVGVRDVVIIDCDTKKVRHWRRRGDALDETEPDAGSSVALTELAVTFRTVDGELAVDTAAGRTLI